jgi:hypothetical protein
VKKLYLIGIFTLFIFAFQSCNENSTDPNELGGNTDLELSKVGSEFGVDVSLDGISDPALNNIEEDVRITKNENGIVTIKGSLSIDEESLKHIDTLMGTQDLSEDLKRQVFDMYKDKFGFTIDTSDKQNLKLDFESKAKITSEGIQGFMYSDGDESRPFTLVKYGANVGDKYKFTTDEGEEIVREVTYKSTEDEYELGFIYIKIMKIEQKMNDGVIDKITYYANHKFGLVGIRVDMINGKGGLIRIFPWAVLV